MMPQLDGIGLAKMLRADPAPCTIPHHSAFRPRRRSLASRASSRVRMIIWSNRSAAVNCWRVSAHVNLSRIRREAEGQIAASEDAAASDRQPSHGDSVPNRPERPIPIRQPTIVRTLGGIRNTTCSACAWEVTDPEDLPRDLEQLQQLVEGGPDFVIEKRYRRKDGTTPLDECQCRWRERTWGTTLPCWPSGSTSAIANGRRRCYESSIAANNGSTNWPTP